MFELSGVVSSVPNISNFYNLALFICQLLIDGNFRNSHILYNPKVFDGRLITEIASICPQSFLWQTTDVTQSSPLHRSPSDHTLQLIFFDPEHLTAEFKQFEKSFDFYRIFIFPSNDEIETKEHISVLKQLNGLNSATLVLQCSSADGSIFVDWISKTVGGISEERMDVDPKAIAVRNQKADDDQENLFDRTFGKYERMQSTIIRVGGFIHRREKLSDFSMIPRTTFFANYYLSALNAPYIKVSYMNAVNPLAPPTDEIVLPKKRKYHEELSDEYVKLEGNQHS